MFNSKIDWCDSTWNPITGCLHGCEYCYARNIAQRFRSKEGHEINEDNVTFIHHFDGSPTIYELNQPCYFDKIEDLDRLQTEIKAPYPYGFAPTFHRYKLDEPQKWKKCRNIFVCSMADLFGNWVPDEWIEEVFKACEKAPQHNYLFLSKNPKRYIELANLRKLPKADNMWYGASATDEESLRKVADVFGDISLEIKTFLSVEPLLGDVTETEKWADCIVSQFMDWVIIGAETGWRKDKVIPDGTWIRSIVYNCYESHNDIPVFMKSSLADIWGEPLIQEFPKELRKNTDNAKIL